MNQKLDDAYQTQFVPLARTYSRNDAIRYYGVIQEEQLVITVKLYYFGTFTFNLHFGSVLDAGQS